MGPAPARLLGGLLAVALLAAALLGACRGGGTAGADEPPAPRVVDVYLAPATGTIGAAYLTLANDGGGDELVGVTSPAADRVELHRSEERGGLAVMVEVDGLDLPAGGELRLVPFGAHLMLVGMHTPLEPGDTVMLELSFRRGDPLRVTGPVLAYDEIDTRLGDPT